MKWADYYEHYDNWQESTQYSRLASVTDWGADTSPSSQIADCIQYVDERTAASILKKALQAGVLFAPDEIVETIDSGITDDVDMIKHLMQSSSGDFTGEQFVTLLNCVMDEDPVLALLKRASTINNYFQEKDFLELAEILMDNDLLEALLRNSDAVFSEEGLNELCDYGIDEDIIGAISKRSGIPYQDPDAEDDLAYAENDIPSESAMDAEEIAQPPEKGFWGTLAEVLAVNTLMDSFEEGTRPKKASSGKCTGDCAHCPPHYGYRYGRWYYGHGHDWGCEFCGNGGCCGKCNRD